MSAEVHVGDIGTQFIATVYDENNNTIDLSIATILQMIFKKPDGTKQTAVGTLFTNGTDGRMQYITVSGDISEHGIWKVQGYVANPSGAWYSDSVTFNVARNL